MSGESAGRCEPAAINRMRQTVPAEGLRRRTFLGCSASALAAAFFSGLARARVPSAYSWDAAPPLDNPVSYMKWMEANRGEDSDFLSWRWSRYEALRVNRDLWDERNMRAFLLTPREEFVLKQNSNRAYEHAFLDIGYGVTISGPHLVGRMTSTIDVKLGEKVLEIGTGSGYQSAYLANLTDKVWTIEIIKPLAERTRGIYDNLIARGYTEFRAINTKPADGYYGWEEAAPFDKIIVTCGIDHIPPPLLSQLRPNGLMVIPVGPPGAHVILKIAKQQNPDGSIRVARSNVYNKVVPFVPFTKLQGDVVKGTHDSPR